MLESAGSEAELEVDGGIDPQTAERVVAAGATVLVAGTAIFGAPEGVTTGIAAIREAARRGQRLAFEGRQKNKLPVVGSCYRVELFQQEGGANETCSTSAGSEYRDASGASDR